MRWTSLFFIVSVACSSAQPTPTTATIGAARPQAAPSGKDFDAALARLDNGEIEAGVSALIAIARDRRAELNLRTNATRYAVKVVRENHEDLPPALSIQALTIALETESVSESDALHLTYLRGRIHWTHERYAEAAPNFESVIRDHPTSAVAEYAANLLLDGLAADKRWAEFMVKVDELVANEALVAARPELARRLARLQRQGVRRIVEELEKNEDWVGCGQGYLDIYNEDPDGQGADEVLYNGGVCFERGGLAGHAIQLFTQTQTRFPKSRLAQRAMVRLAMLYEQIGMFDRAADHYEKYVKKYAGEKDASQALENAVVLRAGLGDESRLRRNVELFMKLYGKKNQREAASAAMMLGRRLERGTPAWTKFLRTFPKLHKRASNADKAFVFVELARIEWDAACSGRKGKHGACKRKRDGVKVGKAESLLQKASRLVVNAWTKDLRLRLIADDIRLLRVDMRAEEKLRERRPDASAVAKLYVDAASQLKSIKSVVALQRAAEIAPASERLQLCRFTVETARKILAPSKLVTRCDELVYREDPKEARPRERRVFSPAVAPILETSEILETETHVE